MLRLWLTIVFIALVAAMSASAQEFTPLSDAPLPEEYWRSNNITPPELIAGDKAEYPVEARFQLMSGLCSFSLVVDVEGNPQNVRIIHCTDSMFEASSLDAARQYRFKPAMRDGKPVPVAFSYVQRYHFAKYALSLRLLINTSWVPRKYFILDRHMGKGEIEEAIGRQIHYGFIPQRGGPSTPDADGVYQQTRAVTGPRLMVFFDEGYGRMAFFHEGSSACDVVLTVSVKGKALDPRINHCEQPELEEVVLNSLLKSTYKPGFVRGKEVPMRGLIHIAYGEITESVPAAQK